MKIIKPSSYSILSSNIAQADVAKINNKVLSSKVSQTGNITLTLKADATRIDYIVFFGLVGASVDVVVTSGAYSTTLSHNVVHRDVQGWLDFFTIQFENTPDFAIQIPRVYQPTLQITINSTGLCEVGEIVVGMSRDIGYEEDKIKIKTIDYSQVEEDPTTGERQFKQGNYIMYYETSVINPNISHFNYLIALRATPVVVLGKYTVMGTIDDTNMSNDGINLTIKGVI